MTLSVESRVLDIAGNVVHAKTTLSATTETREGLVARGSKRSRLLRLLDNGFIERAPTHTDFGGFHVEYVVTII